MNKPFKQLSELVAQANDVFFNQNSNIDTIMGIMDKTLRKQGMNADAVTLDAITLNKKIVFLMHDDKSNRVDIALGNKEGDIHSSSEYDFNDLSVPAILSIIEDNFL